MESAFFTREFFSSIAAIALATAIVVQVIKWFFTEIERKIPTRITSGLISLLITVPFAIGLGTWDSGWYMELVAWFVTWCAGWGASGFAYDRAIDFMKVVGGGTKKD